MRTRLRSAALLLAFTLVGAGLLGCDQGGTSPPMTAEEARPQIIESASGLQGAAATFDQTPLARLSEAMMTSGSEGKTVSPWGKALTSGLGAVLDTTGGNFNYDASTGVYVWNPDTKAWRQERPADSLILRFPESKGAPSNNATFTLSRYETQSVPILGPTEEVPTRVGASLSVDSTEVFALDLEDVSFTSLLGIPQSFSLDVTANPLAFTTSLKRGQNGTFQYEDRFRNDGQPVTATTATVDLSPDDAEGDDSTLDRVEGTTQVGQDLAIEYAADVGALSALEDASADEINNRVSVDVLLQGNQVATLRYDGSAEQVIVEYTDGTTEPLSDLLREIGVSGGAS
ncbi:hypothetical protein GGP55_003158 [Salinibacter ruber]|uniref:hypothetical protein n=1 Tax=Salinibacter ruber TaxID=146919 RepID=UPI002169ADD7|nr:hypothetical protein [Salinibacter ruber]MCS3632540.1 hypothetical protein [Salinibacter ruber]